MPHNLQPGDYACWKGHNLKNCLHPSEKDPYWEKEMATTPLFLPGETCRQRSLAGYSPWCCKRVSHDLATQQQQLGTLSLL